MEEVLWWKELFLALGSDLLIVEGRLGTRVEEGVGRGHCKAR